MYRPRKLLPMAIGVALALPMATQPLTSTPALAAPITAQALNPHGDSDVPVDLAAAVRRDLGLTPEQYVAAGDTAHRAAEIAHAIEGISTSDVEMVDAETIIVRVDTELQAEQVARLGATPVAKTVSNSEALDPFVVPLNAAPPAGSKFVTSDWLTCTLAFWGYNPKGQPVALTAGHCATVGSRVSQMRLKNPWRQAGEAGDSSFGKITARHYGDGQDVALIKAKKKAKISASLHMWNGSKRLPIIGAIEPIVGAPVCKAGARTGWTCGVITELPRSYSLADVGMPRVNGFATSMCSGSGDSGAPVVSGRYAVGVLSFGSFDIRDADVPGACGLPVQRARFLQSALNSYPANAHETLRATMSTNPHHMILTGVVPLLGESDTALGKLGNRFRLAVSVPKPRVTSAKASAKTTTIKGRVKPNGLDPTKFVVTVKARGKAVKVRPNNKGVFTATIKGVTSRDSYSVQVRIAGERYQKSVLVKGRVR